MQLFQTATKLVDHFFAISVSESNNSVNCYFSYPPISESNNTLKNIVPFCFPSAQQSTDGGGGEEPVDGWKDPWYHDFVLTDEKGQKRFATCLKSRLFRVMPVDDNNAHNNDKPQMMDIGCLCLISNQPKFNTLRALLEEVFMCMMSDTSDSSAVEMLTWELIHQASITYNNTLIC